MQRSVIQRSVKSQRKLDSEKLVLTAFFDNVVRLWYEFFVTALAAVIMLGPRIGRYELGIEPLPLGKPSSCAQGLFVLWWGWLAFNSGR